MLNESVERHYPAINVGNLEPSLDGPEQRRETAVDGLEEDEEHERISPIGLYSQYPSKVYSRAQERNLT